MGVNSGAGAGGAVGEIVEGDAPAGADADVPDEAGVRAGKADAADDGIDSSRIVDGEAPGDAWANPDCGNAGIAMAPATAITAAHCAILIDSTMPGTPLALFARFELAELDRFVMLYRTILK
jgi:hypothetical protein